MEPWTGASGATLEAATATKAALEDGGVLWAYLAAPPAGLLATLSSLLYSLCAGLSHLGSKQN